MTLTISLSSMLRFSASKLTTMASRRAARIASSSCSFSTTPTQSQKPKAVFLNASRLDYDDKLDWSGLQRICDLRLNPSDAVRDKDAMIELVRDADIVITKEMIVPSDYFDEFPPTVRLLCEAGTGFNNLPVTQARVRNIPVCNVPTYSTEAVAHMAITYLMNFSVSMFQQQEMLLNDDRANFLGPFTLPLSEINGKTIALVGGAGRIGTKVAQIALALGMHVKISSRKGSLPPNHVLHGHHRVECTSDVDSILQVADYVSLHTPLNDQTRGTFGRKQIQQMKPTAFLINTSRGAVCNEDELIECMEEGIIQGAGLDVTTTEPPSPDSKLWGLKNVYLSPHTGWRRLETRQRLVDMTVDNIQSFVDAKSESDIINVVN
mmetsp:Transcript_16230/g.35590  ORF Transcript_16230/g.35590 Transcript_16230/m.35590 type:complete len:378 (+) Transcript_16230:68-1201(+)